MPRITQSYQIKLPQEPKLQQHLDWLHTLELRAAQYLLEWLWSENSVEMLATSKRKAYKVIGKSQVYLSGHGG